MWASDENLPGRCIQDTGLQNPWTPRSPDITPLYYFLWGHIKSKVYVKNYENISDVKAAIISEFQEMSDGIVDSTMENFCRRLEMVLRKRLFSFQTTSETKIVMCLCIAQNLNVVCTFWAYVDENRTHRTRVIKVLKVDT